ncbi:MAG: phytoene desaturase family protein [Chitinispirillaceae bacterium]
MSKKHVCIIGAGPGSLTAAMILSYRGYRVTLFEKESAPGGRNRALRLGPYTFDTGPTFLIMPFVLRQVFSLAGRKAEDYLDFIPVDPMYHLNFPDKRMNATVDKNRMQQEIDRVFPGNENSLGKFDRRETERYNRMYPCLLKSYSDFSTFLSPTLLRAVPHLALTKSLYSVLRSYFKDEKLTITFTFQAKYLGMSPWECPGAFAIIPYLEHTFGVEHTKGGLNRISEAMARVTEENGARVEYGTPVERVAVDQKGEARGVHLENGEFVEADAVIVGADFGYAMEHLFEPGVIRKWAPDNLMKKRYSCSTFMLYLGVDKIYPDAHHQIIFARDYRKNIEDVVRHKRLSDDFSFYVQNASITDSTLAPQGHSTVYVLVPVPNTKSSIEWNGETVRTLRDRTIRIIKERTSMTDIDAHIVEEKITTPADWKDSYNLFIGSTFNLGHTLDQMLYFRPHNRFEEVGRCYLVGGGTHPGSGLPTIYESGRITANLVSKEMPY